MQKGGERLELESPKCLSEAADGKVSCSVNSERSAIAVLSAHRVRCSLHSPCVDSGVETPFPFPLRSISS